MPADEAEGSPSNSGGQSAGAHTRTYQACIPCRKRKVRCNLGPVDNPHDPPCDRCRRESKECYFSATRRKKRAADAGGDEELEDEEFEVRGGRKRLKGEDEEDSSTPARGYSAFPLVPGANRHARVSFSRPSLTASASHLSHASQRDDFDEEEASAHTAVILQNAEVHGGHDALRTLLEAATTQQGGSTSTGSRHDLMSGRSPHEIPAGSPDHVRHPMAIRPPRSSVIFSPPQSQIDPAFRTGTLPRGSTAADSAADLTSALSAWARFKFVRSGWFTAREAIDYVNFFYTHLSPLTPIVMPDYTPLGSQAGMLEDEPMFAVTILTIASRHMKLGGAGSNSRPYAIHQKLWSYLEGMINRLVWGQEQFGGNGSTTGTQAGCDIVPYHRKGLRTLGTVESLMLLTEWHPRSMHFPPDDDDSELLLPAYSGPDVADLGGDAGNEATKGIGGHRIDTWLEPCWRSDRICWMLLSMAMSLAFEIGVFDENAGRHNAADLSSVSEAKRRAYERRRLHVKDLLMVYTTQTSGRVGLSSMLPKNYCEPALSHIFDLRNVPPGDTKAMVIHLWLRIASIMKTGNEELFANRALTRDIIRTGRYKDLLQGLYPTLTSWRKTMDAAKDIPHLMRQVLIIDYEYCRVYLNSLGLQAVVERCMRNMPPKSRTPLARSTATVDGERILAPDASIPASVLENCYGSDRFYVKEVTDGCRNLLRAVVEGLYPGDSLRHAPVRTYFRIISVAIILLKTFALGATESDVALSLGYLDRTIEALQTSIVDDVHVASRFADLLETLTRRIRQSFVRMTRGGGGGGLGHSRGTSDSPGEVWGASKAQPVNSSALRSSLRQSWSGHPAVRHAGGEQGAARDVHDGAGSNPLWGISSQTFDLDDNGAQFSVMPPPTNPPTPSMSRATSMPNGGPYQGYDGSYGAGVDDGDVPDWLALPLDPILNSYGADVTQNGYGPGVGEYDMLELLLGGGSQ